MRGFPTPGLPDGCAELVKFYLLPQWRGKGVGRCLRQCFESSKQLGYSKLYLESLPELSRAVSMYLEKSGFRHIPHALGKSGHFGCNIWMVKEFKKRNYIVITY